MTQNRIIPSFYIIHKLIATFMFKQKFYGMNVKYLKWKMKGNDGFLLSLVAMLQSMFYHGQLYKEETPIHFGLVTIKVINITPNH